MGRAPRTRTCRGLAGPPNSLVDGNRGSITDVLSPYRVLDLSDERGHLCGLILAGLGAEVIAIEPPGGSRARGLGPFVDDVSDLEGSLTHFAYNRGKKSVVLDLETELDRQRLKQLAATADVLIESATPGRMAELGLGYDDLSQELPHLVYVSISAFGQTGPKARWAATDLTVMASAATMSVTGDEDRAPVRVTAPQGFHFGAASAAAGALVALTERHRSGLGQHIDAAAQWTATLGTQAGLLATGVGTVDATRTAGGAVMGDIRLRLVYPAADGYVSITHVFGMPIGQNTARLMEWVYEEGFCDAAMKDKDWVGYLDLLESGKEPISEWEAAKAAVEALTSSKTKAELLVGAMERGLLMAPISTPAEVVTSEQLAAREFFDEVEHPRSGRLVKVPGAFAKCSARPLPVLDPAPRLGQHTDAVLAELETGNGHRRQPASTATQVDAPASGEPPTAGRGPLSGLRVLDFTWSIAGPHSIRLLADFGATIVKIESANKQDAARGYRPVHNNEAGIENSALFDTMGAGKNSLALDMSKPDSLDVIRDLIEWCDVVTESYSPKAMAKWGLDYENLVEIKPDVIMVSTCLAGQYGPLANFAGYGNLGAAFAGFYGLAGWPDRPPAGPFGAYTDYTSTHFLAATLLAALDHRRRTGEGQHIDMAQSEAAQHFMSPAILDYSVNGRVMERQGNRDPHMAPHGVYPTAGHDRWIAVACTDDASWAALTTFMDAHDLADDHDLSTVDGRLARADELDERMAAWTASFDNVDLAARLQRIGVAAHIVSTNEDILQDDHVMRRGFYSVRPTSRFTRDLFSGYPLRFSETPGSWERGGPSSGEHTVEVLTEVAGLGGEAVDQLIADDAAFTMVQPDLQLSRPYEEWLHILLPNDALDSRDL